MPLQTYVIETTSITRTFKSRGLDGIRRKLWAIPYANITRDDGCKWIWDGKKLFEVTGIF